MGAHTPEYVHAHNAGSLKLSGSSFGLCSGQDHMQQEPVLGVGIQSVCIDKIADITDTPLFPTVSPSRDHALSCVE